MDPLLLTGPISPAVRSHLKLVYLTLLFALAACTAGAYLYVVWNISGLLSFIGFFQALAWLKSTPPLYTVVVRAHGTPYCFYDQKKRFLILMLVSVLEGAAVGPAVKMAIKLDSSVLSTILMATVLTFGSFWAVAAVAQRREILYLGGLLSSCFLFIVWLLFASSIIGPSVAVFKVEPYLGLLIFMGLFVFDTHQTIKKAQLCEIDHISHALTLCTDFFAVLVTVVVVTVKDFQYTREERRRRMRGN